MKNTTAHRHKMHRQPWLILVAFLIFFESTYLSATEEPSTVFCHQTEYFDQVLRAEQCSEVFGNEERRTENKQHRLHVLE